MGKGFTFVLAFIVVSGLAPSLRAQAESAESGDHLEARASRAAARPSAAPPPQLKSNPDCHFALTDADQKKLVEGTAELQHLYGSNQITAEERDRAIEALVKSPSAEERLQKLAVARQGLVAQSVKEVYPLMLKAAVQPLNESEKAQLKKFLPDGVDDPKFAQVVKELAPEVKTLTRYGFKPNKGDLRIPADKLKNDPEVFKALTSFIAPGLDDKTRAKIADPTRRDAITSGDYVFLPVELKGRDRDKVKIMTRTEYEGAVQRGLQRFGSDLREFMEASHASNTVTNFTTGRMWELSSDEDSAEVLAKDGASERIMKNARFLSDLGIPKELRDELSRNYSQALQHDAEGLKKTESQLDTLVKGLWIGLFAIPAVFTVGVAVGGGFAASTTVAALWGTTGATTTMLGIAGLFAGLNATVQAGANAYAGDTSFLCQLAESARAESGNFLYSSPLALLPAGAKLLGAGTGLASNSIRAAELVESGAHVATSAYFGYQGIAGLVQQGPECVKLLNEVAESETEGESASVVESRRAAAFQKCTELGINLSQQITFLRQVKQGGKAAIKATKEKLQAYREKGAVPDMSGKIIKSSAKEAADLADADTAKPSAPEVATRTPKYREVFGERIRRGLFNSTTTKTRLASLEKRTNNKGVLEPIEAKIKQNETVRLTPEETQRVRAMETLARQDVEATLRDLANRKSISPQDLEAMIPAFEAQGKLRDILRNHGDKASVADLPPEYDPRLSSLWKKLWVTASANPELSKRIASLEKEGERLEKQKQDLRREALAAAQKYGAYKKTANLMGKRQALTDEFQAKMADAKAKTTELIDSALTARNELDAHQNNIGWLRFVRDFGPDLGTGTLEMKQVMSQREHHDLVQDRHNLQEFGEHLPLFYAEVAKPGFLQVRTHGNRVLADYLKPGEGHDVAGVNGGYRSPTQKGIHRESSSKQLVGKVATPAGEMVNPHDYETISDTPVGNTIVGGITGPIRPNGKRAAPKIYAEELELSKLVSDIVTPGGWKYSDFQKNPDGFKGGVPQVAVARADKTVTLDTGETHTIAPSQFIKEPNHIFQRAWPQLPNEYRNFSPSVRRAWLDKVIPIENKIRDGLYERNQDYRQLRGDKLIDSYAGYASDMAKYASSIQKAVADYRRELSAIADPETKAKLTEQLRADTFNRLEAYQRLVVHEGMAPIPSAQQLYRDLFPNSTARIGAPAEASVAP